MTERDVSVLSLSTTYVNTTAQFPYTLRINVLSFSARSIFLSSQVWPSKKHTLHAEISSYSYYYYSSQAVNHYKQWGGSKKTQKKCTQKKMHEDATNAEKTGSDQLKAASEKWLQHLILLLLPH